MGIRFFAQPLPKNPTCRPLSYDACTGNSVTANASTIFSIFTTYVEKEYMNYEPSFSPQLSKIKESNIHPILAIRCETAAAGLPYITIQPFIIKSALENEMVCANANLTSAVIGRLTPRWLPLTSTL